MQHGWNEPAEVRSLEDTAKTGSSVGEERASAGALSGLIAQEGHRMDRQQGLLSG